MTILPKPWLSFLLALLLLLVPNDVYSFLQSNHNENHLNRRNTKLLPKSSITTTTPTTTTTTQRYSFFSLSTLDGFYETQPYIAAFLTCAFKASAADALAQSKSSSSSPSSAVGTNDDVYDNNDDDDDDVMHYQTFADQSSSESTTHIDFCRNLSFILYGGFYQGMGQTFLYSHLYPSLFGTESTAMTVLAQASMENFLLAPFFCLPVVYTIKSILAGDDVLAGVEKYWDHIHSQHVLIKYWSLWFPVQCINFAFVPEHLRVPFSAIVSFFWVCMLSSISSQETVATTKTATNASTAAVSATQQISRGQHALETNSTMVPSSASFATT